MDRYIIREQIIERFKLCANEISNAQSISEAYSILDNFAMKFSPLDTLGHYKKNFIQPLYKIKSIPDIVSAFDAQVSKIEKNGCYYEKMFF